MDDTSFKAGPLCLSAVCTNDRLIFGGGLLALWRCWEFLHNLFWPKKSVERCRGTQKVRTLFTRPGNSSESAINQIFSLRISEWVQVVTDGRCIAHRKHVSLCVAATTFWAPLNGSMACMAEWRTHSILGLSQTRCALQRERFMRGRHMAFLSANLVHLFS